MRGFWRTVNIKIAARMPGNLDLTWAETVQMLKLISDEALGRLLAFSADKKLAFLMLLFERMLPELQSFCLVEDFDFRVLQKARDEYWRRLSGQSSPVVLAQLREDILRQTPDTEDFGTPEGSFALNAALVAWDIVGFIDDEGEGHLTDAMRYATETLHARVMDELTPSMDRATVMTIGSKAVDYFQGHPLVEKERRVEDDDIRFLSTMPEGPWPGSVLATLRQRIENQSGLLESN